MENGILHYPGDGGRWRGIWSRTMPSHARLVALLVTGLAASAISGCGAAADDLFCDDTGCGFSDLQWSRLAPLANLRSVPVDQSNGVFGNKVANTLGRFFFQDPRFSGLATQVEAIGRPAAVARAPKGQPTNLSCASCHDLGRMGVDVTSTPGNVSSGAGWTDVNALSVFDSSFQRLYFWNGRADSQWALAFAVAESPTTMNGNRLQTAHVIADSYRDLYDAAFGVPKLAQPMPIPRDHTVCAISSLVAKTGPNAGQCTTCDPNLCRIVIDDNGLPGGCWPQVPAAGQAGQGRVSIRVIRSPSATPSTCMDPGDQDRRHARPRELGHGARVVPGAARQRRGHALRRLHQRGPALAGHRRERARGAPSSSWARPGASTVTTRHSCPMAPSTTSASRRSAPTSPRSVTAARACPATA